MEDLLHSTALKTVAALLVVGVLIRTILRALSRPKGNPMSRRARCRDCGWTGSVGKYNKVCSGCNSTNLQIRAGG